MEFLPVFLKIKGRPCLVVGGGKVAVRKVGLLRRAGAEITVVAPVFCDELLALREAGDITFHHREFSDADVSNFVLVIAATDDRDVNRLVFQLIQGNDRGSNYGMLKP